MQAKKYGTVPTNEILKDDMVHGFERMCVVYGSIVVMVRHFSFQFTLMINIVNKTFLKITQVMELALVVTTVQAKNDDHDVWISKQGIVFFEIFVCEIKHFV